MQVDMILAHNSFKDLDVQRITHLAKYVTAAQLNISGQNLITIFRYPNKVNLYTVHAMTTFAVFHITWLYYKSNKYL